MAFLEEELNQINPQTGRTMTWEPLSAEQISMYNKSKNKAYTTPSIDNTNLTVNEPGWMVSWTENQSNTNNIPVSWKNYTISSVNWLVYNQDWTLYNWWQADAWDYGKTFPNKPDNQDLKKSFNESFNASWIKPINNVSSANNPLWWLVKNNQILNGKTSDLSNVGTTWTVTDWVKWTDTWIDTTKATFDSFKVDNIWTVPTETTWFFKDTQDFLKTNLTKELDLLNKQKADLQKSIESGSLTAEDQATVLEPYMQFVDKLTALKDLSKQSIDRQTKELKDRYAQSINNQRKANELQLVNAQKMAAMTWVWFTSGWIQGLNNIIDEWANDIATLEKERESMLSSYKEKDTELDITYLDTLKTTQDKAQQALQEKYNNIVTWIQKIDAELWKTSKEWILALKDLAKEYLDQTNKEWEKAYKIADFNYKKFLDYKKDLRDEEKLAQDQKNQTLELITKWDLTWFSDDELTKLGTEMDLDNATLKGLFGIRERQNIENNQYEYKPIQEMDANGNMITTWYIGINKTNPNDIINLNTSWAQISPWTPWTTTWATGTQYSWDLPNMTNLRGTKIVYTWNVWNDLNNPWNLTRWWVADKYAIWYVTVTWKDWKQRDFLVFPNRDAWYSANADDLNAKMAGNTRTWLWPTSTLGQLLDTWVWWKGAWAWYKNTVASTLWVNINSKLWDLTNLWINGQKIIDWIKFAEWATAKASNDYSWLIQRVPVAWATTTTVNFDPAQAKKYENVLAWQYPTWVKPWSQNALKLDQEAKAWFESKKTTTSNVLRSPDDFQNIEIDTKATADQRKSKAYADRMNYAVNNILKVENSFANKWSPDQAFQTFAPNWLKSQDQQLLESAKQNFITASLRQESWAAISPSEFSKEEKKYFPQIWDTKETIAAKQKAREFAIKAMYSQAWKDSSWADIGSYYQPKKIFEDWSYIKYDNSWNYNYINKDWEESWWLPIWQQVWTKIDTKTKFQNYYKTKYKK